MYMYFQEYLVLANIHTLTGLYTSSTAAFAAEFHKMATVMSGMAQCFAVENKECERYLDYEYPGTRTCTYLYSYHYY